MNNNKLIVSTKQEGLINTRTIEGTGIGAGCSVAGARLEIFCAALTGVLASHPDKATMPDIAVLIAIEVTDEAVAALHLEQAKQDRS
jgi:hypothetical protein